ncbi:MAG TPA: hypothetical protein PK771_00415 [Spirochaetota bacterium]|nr:hypothetical protein [Spirochaetota bacterium]
MAGSDLKEKEVKKEDLKTQIRNFIITFIIGLIIVTFIFTGGPLLGMNDFVRDIGKTKVKNEDGTISIPQDAQVAQNSENPNAYVGRIKNQKIQLGKRDDFNIRLSQIFGSQLNPYQKYQYARYIFDSTMNKIIGMKKAVQMNLIISKDWQLKEVGKRYFSDVDGDPDYIAMKKDISKVNQYSKDVQESLLYESFVNDYFKGLPISGDEIFNEYKLENVKVTLKYVNLSSQEVDENLLKKYYEENKENYKQYKLTRLVFKEKTEAEKALKEIEKDKSKFGEIGNKLKVEDKVINIIYDSEYSFIDDFENIDLKNAVKAIQKGDLCKSYVQTTIGPILFMLTDVVYGEYTVEKVKSKVKNEYIAKNILTIEANTKDKATEIYNEAKKNGFEKTAAKFNLKVETSSPAVFLGYGLPYINPDNTDDKNYFATVFKSEKNTVLEPFKHSNGFMIALVNDKTTINKDEFDNMYEELLKKYSDNKSANIENDFYTKERKNYEVIDNFNYVFKIQDFISKEQQ